MPSFLVTPKMNPALRARVLRSLGGRTPSARLPVRAIALLRFVAVAALVASVLGFFSFQKEQAERLERAKRELREKLTRHAVGLEADDLQTLPRVEKWLAQVPEPPGDDFVVEELRGEASIGRLFARRLVYARGKARTLTEKRDVQAFIAGSTSRDFLVGCLLEPPPAPDEKALLAHLARLRNDAFDASDRVESLAAAAAGLPLLSPEWPARLDGVDSLLALRPHRELVERAPLAEAKRAAQAELVILVLDEPNAAGTPVELDGTGQHAVRFALFDLRAERELVRLRRTVDPAWISPEHRQRWAGDLVDCRLGAELRRELACEPPCSETRRDPPLPASSKPE